MQTVSKEKGFTLIELLVVIAIIGILASVVLASLNSSRTKSKNAAVVSQMYEYQKALELYYNLNGRYPAGHSTNRSRLICIGDGAVGGCMPSAFGNLVPNSEVETGLSEFLSSLPTFQQPVGENDYSSPAYNNCSYQDPNSPICGLDSYSLWYVLEGTELDCGKGVVMESNLRSTHTRCRIFSQN